ncbi:hypothetical protein MNBD_GAMMA12-2586 [hydrothermal vent metagenome]|uniref:Uncharacterized protein n=1 Tax=hydrothermal vent metagenome TaxID=652676 RepID=A0A3B0YNI9_9ZZZZ
MKIMCTIIFLIIGIIPLQAISKGPGSVVYKPIHGVSVTHIFPNNAQFRYKHIAGIKGFIPVTYRRGRNTRQQRLFIESVTNTHFIVHRKTENHVASGSGIMYKVHYQVLPIRGGFKLVLSPVGVDTYREGLIGRFKIPKFSLQELLQFLQNNRQLVTYEYSLRVGTRSHTVMRNINAYAKKIGQLPGRIDGSSVSYIYSGSGWKSGFTMDSSPSGRGVNLRVRMLLRADKSSANTLDYLRPLNQIKQYIKVGSNSRSQFVAKLRTSVLRFRRKLKVGDYSHCGLVVAVNKPVAKLQTAMGEHWLRIDKLYPKRAMPCKFVDNKYIDP